MDFIHRNGAYHARHAQSWSCKVFKNTDRCQYHRDAAKTYWALAMLHDKHTASVMGALDCIMDLEMSGDSNTRYLDPVSDCLRNMK